MKVEAKIRLVTHPFPIETLQARMDQAIITRQSVIERPYYFENTGTGQRYYDLCSCIGWPSKQEQGEQQKDAKPGYIAVVGIIKPKQEDAKAEDAVFQLLEESEDQDVPSLIEKWLVMRRRWGFGLSPGLLSTLIGDPDRFVSTLALVNEKLIRKEGERAAILISPPDNFYDTSVFDIYVRSLHSVFIPKMLYARNPDGEPRPRFYHGNCEILKTRLRQFRRDDPVVMAMGGLVHSLLIRTTWMDQNESNVFNVEEKI